MRRLICCFVCFLWLTGTLFAADRDFNRKVYSLRWIAYAPTHFNPNAKLYPDRRSLEQDLKVLRDAGFSGIITYGSEYSLAEIPEIAKALGFQGVIMGIWDIRDSNEIASAIFMADYVDGYCVGNEGLYKRYDLDELKKAIDYIKAKTHRPATTTEEIFDYAKTYVLEIGDWIFPNVHPFLSSVKDPAPAVNWIKGHYRIIKRHADQLKKPVLFKEIGYPTRGDIHASAKNQKKFFDLIEKSGVNFAYFEAFDQYWKRWLPVEPHWGLFDKNRKPKSYIKLKRF